MRVHMEDGQTGVDSESQVKTSGARPRQRDGRDSVETFAPTVSTFYVRLLCAILCELDFDLLCDFDVHLQSHLDENDFLRLPKGCVNCMVK